MDKIKPRCITLYQNRSIMPPHFTVSVKCLEMEAVSTVTFISIDEPIKNTSNTFLTCLSQQGPKETFWANRLSEKYIMTMQLGTTTIYTVPNPTAVIILSCDVKHNKHGKDNFTLEQVLQKDSGNGKTNYQIMKLKIK